ncbi:MAG TPA: acyltransferase [Candidatus Nanopelagicales bacterium]|nr:acyltransferase [Candidatus Nanopelagicales bacterium]
MASGTQQRFIGQLTGVRFVAAFWVLLYHYQGALATAGLLVPVLHEVLRVGRLGVDLFFALSGFILTHTYLTKLGPKVTWPGSRHFWWLRLARIWPVHFVMLNVAGLAVIAQSKVTGADASTRDWLNPVDYVKQLLLVHEWGPNPQRGWNFPAWSLSMEWLAYLLFPLLVLVLFRFRDKVPTRGLMLLWCVVLVPLLWYGVAYYGDPYYISDWGSTIRILTEFTAGGLTYLIVLRYWSTEGPRPRVERLATTLSIVLPLVVVGAALFLGHVGALQWTVSDLPDTPNAADLPPKYHLVLVPLLIAWIGALALTSRGPSRWLSTDRLVLGGFISFSLYMTHTVWYGLWRAGMSAVHIKGGVLYLVSFVGLVVGAIVIAWLMWKYVEEPAREWMRRRSGERPKPVEEIALESDGR